MRTISRLALGALGALALFAAAPSGAHAQQRVRCESRGYDRTYCSADTRGGVELVRQISDASCSRGRTWGTSNRGVWVSNGCRGDFAVGSSYGGGYGGSGDYDRDRRNGDDGRYGRKDDRSHDRGRWEDRRDDRRDGRGDGRYGRSAISRGQAESLCRNEVRRTIRSARNGRVDVSSASWESRYNAYGVRWSTRNGERGTCQVRADGGRVSVYRSR
jgi:hypothetical protein